MRSLKVIALLCFIGVAIGADWSIQVDQLATIATAVSFSSSTRGMIPISDNGSGSGILESTDAGKTWNAVTAPQAGFYLGGSAQGNSAVASAIFGIQYSNSTSGPYVFDRSTGLAGFTGQSVEAMLGGSGEFFGATGAQAIGNGNGVAVTNDGGASFSWINVTELTTLARYGSFPSANVWYLSAGTWPSNSSVKAWGPQIEREDLGHGLVSFRKHLTNRISVTTGFSKATREFRMPMAVEFRQNETPMDDGWEAQIVKSADGGKTWTSVFSDSNNFYFNQIDCSSETHCVAVGEADTSAEPGVRIYVTSDGGSTWTRTMYNADPNMSLFAVRHMSDTEWWVGGGEFTQTGITGYFYQSTDGGNTWTSTTTAGIYPNSLSFPTSSLGFATCFNQDSTSSLAVYN